MLEGHVSCLPTQADVLSHIQSCQQTSFGAGDNLLELYAHMQGQETPCLGKPALSALSAVAHMYTKRHNWPAAMAIAHDMAHSERDAAAEAVVPIKQGLQASGSSAGHAASRPLLHSTAHSADVVQVGAVRLLHTWRKTTPMT